MSGLPKIAPMELIRVSVPFDDPEFIYEVKFDGFRALAYVQGGQCELVSRKGHVYRRFAELRRRSRQTWLLRTASSTASSCAWTTEAAPASTT